MYRNDFDLIILRHGELHIHMAMLRTIGAYIDGSGLDLCWYVGMFGKCTTTKKMEDSSSYSPITFIFV